MRDIPHEKLTTFTGDYYLDGDRVCRSRNEKDNTVWISRQDSIDQETTEGQIALCVAYGGFIEDVSLRLSLGYSVLVVCDKALIEGLRRLILQNDNLRGREHTRVTAVPARGREGEAPGVDRLAANLYAQLTNAAPDPGRVVIVEHLDLMTTTLEGRPGSMANDIVYWLCQFKNVPVLAFADPALPLPRVIQDLFTEVKTLPPLDRENLYLLLRPEEAQRISHDVLKISDQLQLYQYVSGVNALSFRRLMRQICGHFQALDVGTLEVQRDAANEVYKFIRARTATGQLQVPAVMEEDIAGYGEVKEACQKRIMFPMRLRNRATSAEELERADLMIPKGVILYGPPRNGKTEIAKWVAASLNAPLIVIRGPELKNMWQGETERAIRRAFTLARRAAPSIILIDELDALTPARDARASSGEVSMVAMFLTEMDGLDRDEAVLVIGTTNRPDAVDPAFKAPGRFGVMIEVDYPSPEDRLAILRRYRDKMHLSKSGLSLSDESLRTLADKTADPRQLWSCDHLRGICQTILLEAEWRRSLSNGKWPDVNEESFLDHVIETVRNAPSRKPATAGEKRFSQTRNLRRN